MKHLESMFQRRRSITSITTAAAEYTAQSARACRRSRGPSCKGHTRAQAAGKPRLPSSVDETKIHSSNIPLC
jgi:hypothetical protein